MTQDFILDMMANCKTTRDCNRYLHKNGIKDTKIHCVRRSFSEPRRTYGLYIFVRDDNPSYRLMYRSTELWEIIFSLGMIYPRKEQRCS